MSIRPPPAGLEESDFDRIEAAVMETERGRWFLAEYAHRVRAEANGDLMQAFARLEGALVRGVSDAVVAPRRLALHLMALEERLQDLAWRLQEDRPEGAQAALALEIAALRELGKRLLSVDPSTDNSDATEQLDLPRREGGGRLSQRLRSIDEIGQMEPIPALSAATEVAAEPDQEPQEAAPALEDCRQAAFAAVEALSMRERLAYFA